jgi:hypothetical protein
MDEFVLPAFSSSMGTPGESTAYVYYRHYLFSQRFSDFFLSKSYGVYLANNIFPGATYLDFAFVGGLSISQTMLVSPIATMIVAGTYWATIAPVSAEVCQASGSTGCAVNYLAWPGPF